MGGSSGRCHRHAGLAATQAQQAASQQNAVQHGYFVSGFLDKAERELFEQVLRGALEPAELKRQMIAALVVRAARMTKWEAQGEKVSGFTTDVFAELRQALDALAPEELHLKHSWDDAEVARQVEVLLQDHELLVRLLPPRVQGVVRQALREAGE